MIYISHRGNLNGPDKANENSPNYINDAIMKGYNVEVDVWYKKGDFYLGHDFSDYKINNDFLARKNIWCHAKNINALVPLQSIKAHYFWHQKDDVTITSRGFIWTYPGKQLTANSICVLPEIVNQEQFDCYGVCSDFVLRYQKLND